MRWIILAFLFVLYILNFADKSVLGLAADPIIDDLALDFEKFGLAGSSFYWFYAVGSILIASLSLKFGTKRLIILLAFGWTISLVSVYLVEGITGLIIIRVLLGFFEGGTLALCLAHLAKWFSEGARGTANAILLSGATFGAYLTAPILVSLISSVGWRHTFASLGLLSFIWLIVFAFFREEPADKIDSADQIGELDNNYKRPEYKDIFSVIFTPYFISILISFFTVMWLIAWVVVWGPTYLTKIVGLSSGRMSIVFAAIGISASLISIIVGRFTDNLFKRTKNAHKSYIRVAVLSLIISGLSIGLTTVTETPILSILFLLIAVTMNNCIAPFTSSVVSQMVHPNLAGSLLGFKTAVGSLAGIIAPLLTGILVSVAGEDIKSGFNLGVLVLVVLYGVSAILLYLSSRREEIRVKDEIELNKIPSV